MDFLDDEDKMQDYFKLTKDEFLKSYSYLKEEDYDATTKALQVSKLSILKELLEQTEHNIACYSDNYLCSKPKKQYVKQWSNETRKAEVIKSMIKDEKERNKNISEAERREM